MMLYRNTIIQKFFIVVITLCAVTTMYSQVEFYSDAYYPKENDQFTVDLKANGLADIISGQFELSYDASILKLISVNNSIAIQDPKIGVKVSNSQNWIRVLLSDNTGKDGIYINDGSSIFQIVFQVVGKQGDINRFAFTDGLPVEFVTTKSQELSVTYNFEDITVVGSTAVMDLVENDLWVEDNYIHFSERVTSNFSKFRILSISGHVLADQDFLTSANTFAIPSHWRNSFYIIQLSNAQSMISKKLFFTNF